MATNAVHCAQEVMHSLVGVLLSRNIRAQQIAAAAIADICAVAPRMEDAFLAVRPLSLRSYILAISCNKQARLERPCTRSSSYTVCGPVQVSGQSLMCTVCIRPEQECVSTQHHAASIEAGTLQLSLQIGRSHCRI